MRSFIKSTLLNKVVMAVTGLLLALFILGHTVGNMQIFMGKEVFNTYAHFLQSLGELLWVIRGTLFVALILHVITSIKLAAQNSSARPVGYKRINYKKANIYSRSMLWTGLAIFVFLGYHILHFTVGTTNPDHYDTHEYYVPENPHGFPNQLGGMMLQGIASENPEESTDMKGLMEELGEKNPNFDDGALIASAPFVNKRHDVFSMMIKSYRLWPISLAYIVGVILLGFHLTHAVQSIFQSVGLNGPRFTPFMIGLSNAFAIIIVLCLISIPLAVLAGYGGAV